MDWRIKALLQKFLSLTNIGDKINHLSVISNAKYHENVFIYQFHECLRKFSHYNLVLNKNAVALEIGTGYSIISSVLLSLMGFQKVISVDKTDDINFAAFKKQILFINQQNFIVAICEKSTYSEIELTEKIETLLTKSNFKELFDFLNIVYLAPYNFEDIDKQSLKFDYITSQVVLEHVQPEILEVLFKKTNLWLTNVGFCVHTINFIDHFANPGFFQDKSISEFNFLRYSNKYWKFWAGNSIAYTNRLSYLYYLELSNKYDLSIIDFIGENYRQRVELNPNLIHNDVINKYSFSVDINKLTKYQRGTLILKKNKLA